MKRVLLLGGLLLLVGCGGGEDPSPDPSTSTSTTSSVSEPPGSHPSESSQPPTGDGAPVAVYLPQITRSDASRDAQAVRRCADKDPASARCKAQVEGLNLSAQAMVLQFGRLGTPAPEIADLVNATVASSQAAYDAGTAYLSSCPEAGATSEQCATDLVALAEGPAADLVTAVAGWDEYL